MGWWQRLQGHPLHSLLPPHTYTSHTSLHRKRLERWLLEKELKVRLGMRSEGEREMVVASGTSAADSSLRAPIKCRSSSCAHVCFGGIYCTSAPAAPHYRRICMAVATVGNKYGGGGGSSGHAWSPLLLFASLWEGGREAGEGPGVCDLQL